MEDQKTIKEISAAVVCFTSLGAKPTLSRVRQSAVLFLLLLLLAAFLSPAFSYPHYNFDKIADAIYLAEGGKKAKKPFGILSVPCSGYSDCRRICLNTIRNNFKRWQKAGSQGDFIDFLGSRYAPVESHPLNKNWIPNVKRLLEASK